MHIFLSLFFTFALLTGLAASARAQAFVPKLSLTWIDRATDEIGFAIERGLLPAGPFTEVATAPANVLTYRDTTVTMATVYCYRLRAWNERTINSKVEKQYSEYSNVTCGSSVPVPSAPTDLLLSAQEAIGTAQELLGSATANIARALQHKE